jgi:hypothetical protein
VEEGQPSSRPCGCAVYLIARSNTSPVNYWEASPEKNQKKKKCQRTVASRGPCAPRPFERRACATRRPQGGAAGGDERAARAALTGRACAQRNWHGARATSSVDGWASTVALRSHARGRGGGCEVFRAPPSLGRHSSKRASEPNAEPRPRARWSTHYSPRAPAVSLTRRLRRAVAGWPEEPGLTPAPTLLRRRHLLLHGHRAASPGATSLGGATRGAAMRG